MVWFLSLASLSFGFANELLAANKYALLVGCTEYPLLREQHGEEQYERTIRLLGPANDAEIIRSLLVERFEFPQESIQSLVGWHPQDPDQRPTRANIEKAFAELARKAGPGDEVVIFMAGHGSQQPAPPGVGELDGLDEIFLPADVRDGSGNRVERAIIDDEVGRWLEAILENGAFVWITFDSCHSGTMVRGVAQEHRRHRFLDPSLLGVSIPRPAVRGTRGGGPSRFADATPGMVDSEKKRLVALYATLPFQTAPEEPLPRNAPATQTRYQGALSYTLTSILSRTQSRLTYRELLERLVADYRSGPYSWPTPFAEGDLDREVLGLNSWPERSRIQLDTRESPWTVTAGSLMGLTPGTILAVHPPPGSEKVDLLLGHVRVTEVRATSALVEPVDHNGHPRVEQFPDRARCKTVYRDLGDLRLKLAIQSEVGSRGSVGETRLIQHFEESIPEDLEARTEAIEATAGKFVQLVPRLEDAEWVVRFDLESRVHLFPAEEAGAKTPNLPTTTLGAQSTVEWSNALARRFQQVYRWQNLKRLASTSTSGLQGDPTRSGLEVDFLKCRDQEDSQCQAATPGEKLTVGQHVAVRIRNQKRDVDVTILFLDSRFGITPLFPLSGESSRLGYDDREPLFLPLGTTTGESLGREHLLVVVLPGKPDRPPVDFTWLAQPSLPRDRSTSSGSPLEKLLAYAAFAEGTTRGTYTSGAGLDAHFVLISWETVAEPTPN